jgi:long-chain acyl-CoA synthetase
MIYALLCEQAARRPESVAVAGELTSLTYGRLLHEVDKAAAYLQSLPVRRGDSILIGIPPCLDLYVVFHAVSALGITLIPVLPSEKIPLPILKARPVAAVGQESFVRDAKSSFSGLKHGILWSREGGLGIPEADAPFRQPARVCNDPVLAVSSSGTTGVPSIHYRSAEVMSEQAQLRVQILGLTAGDALLATRPFNNGSSFNQYVVMPLAGGCKVVVREKFQRFTAIEAIAREKVTILYAVPFVFELLASLPQDFRADMSSVRLCVSVAAPLSRSVWQSFYDRFGIFIRQGYGASHVSPLFTYSPSGLHGPVGHVSRPFPIAVVDDRQTVQGPEQVGEIAFDCSGLAPNWKRFFENKPNRAGKYLLTGDLGRIDAAGNLYVVGRKSPFIKVGGNRVEPAEVEDVLRSHPDVVEAVVYGLHPGQSDESVAAVIVPAKELTAEEILRHCARRLDGYKCPRKIDFRKELERNAHGKIARHIFAGSGRF